MFSRLLRRSLSGWPRKGLLDVFSCCRREKVDRARCGWSLSALLKSLTPFLWGGAYVPFVLMVLYLEIKSVVVLIQQGT